MNKSLTSHITHECHAMVSLEHIPSHTILPSQVSQPIGKKMVRLRNARYVCDTSGNTNFNIRSVCLQVTKKEELLKSADFYPCQFESRSRSHSHSLGLHVLVSDKSACALIEIALSSFVSHTRDSPHISRMTNLGCKRTRTASHKPQSQIHHFTNYIEWNHNIPTTDVVIMRFHIFFFFSTQNLLFQFECVHDAER